MIKAGHPRSRHALPLRSERVIVQTHHVFVLRVISVGTSPRYGLKASGTGRTPKPGAISTLQKWSGDTSSCIQPTFAFLPLEFPPAFYKYGQMFKNAEYPMT